MQYECRKTLADSRPRIRGRFARNDEIDEMMIKTISEPTTTTTLDEDEEYYDQDDDDNWINFLDAFSANLLP